MRVIVIGAGVAGVTTAYSLAARGHDVEVLERGSDVAEEASGANAGLLVPPDSIVWNSPSAPKTLLDAIARQRSDQFIHVRAAAVPSLVGWGIRFFRHSTPVQFQRSVAAAHALSSYSYDQLEQLVASDGSLGFDHERNGMVFLFRTSTGLQKGEELRSTLAALGENYQRLDGNQLVALDNGYRRVAPDLAGALFAPNAGHGDCAAFCRALRQKSERLGVQFAFGVRVEGFDLRGGRVVAAKTAQGLRAADGFVLSAGAHSSRIARSVGISVPIAPSRGYAITVEIEDGAAIPAVGGVDEDQHVAFSRMGGRLRISSVAEFAGYRSPPRASYFAQLEQAGRVLFGDALTWKSTQRTTGLRPMAPDGLPYIGRTTIPNLFLNAGHGQLGWTQACGSARLLSDLIGDGVTEIDWRAYSPVANQRRQVNLSTRL